MSYDEHIMKICVCCKRKLKFVVNLKKSLVNNLSNISPTNCQCCSKEFEMDVKCIAVTEEIESQFYKLTHEKVNPK